MTGGVTLLTPSFRGDLERFRFQRESVRRCGVDLPHIVVVHDEDLPLFAEFAGEPGLEVLSTRDALGRSLDRRRRAWGVRRLNPLHWTVRRPVHGWTSQQLIKLAAGNWIDTEGIVCLDSDVFFIDRVTSEDFFAPDGRLHLYETDDGLDGEMAHWLGESMRFLGVPLQGQPLRKYTHHPVCFHREVLREMQQHIASRHGIPWAEAFIREQVTEYTTYGVFASQVHRLRRVVPARPRLTMSFWWRHEVETFEQEFLPRVEAGGEKMVLIQSNVRRPVEDFRSLIVKAWDLRHAGVTS